MSEPTVAITTLGCRLNQAESDAMADDLARRGVRVAAAGEEPDLVVINTCTVTREATKASRSAIRRSVREHPGARVVVAGCYATSDRAEVEAIAGVDVVLDNTAKESLGAVLGAAPETRPLLRIGFPAPPPPAPSRVRANLKVQTGCDELCSFCIIPRTRGPLRSMAADDLVEEARAKVVGGARELVLTGVHLGKYGYDDGGDERDLLGLLERLARIEGLWRLRLSSILSRHLTEDVVAFIAAQPKMCRYLHVPLQAGDDGVLEAMQRPYRIDDYVEAVQRARSAISGLALATDVIVGFPGESDAAFEATLDVVRAVGFSKLHVFRYSARPGTPAADMAGALGPEVKRQRSKRLIELGNELRAGWLRSHLGRRLEVLVEDERAVEATTVCSGQTDDHVRVWFEGSGLLGSMAEVAGERVRADGIEGRLGAGGGP